MPARDDGCGSKKERIEEAEHRRTGTGADADRQQHGDGQAGRLRRRPTA